MTRFTPLSTGFSLFVISRNRRQFEAQPEAVCDEPHVLPPVWRRPQPAAHAHQDHEINIITGGTCRYVWETGGETQTATVSVGNLFLVPGGVRHIIQVDDYATVCGLWIHPQIIAAVPQSSETLHDFRQPLAPRLMASANQSTALGELFEQTQLEYARSRDAWQTEAVRAIGRLAAIAFVRLMTDTSPSLCGAESAAGARVAAVRSYMDRNYAADITLDDLAQKASLSLSQFCLLFRKATGTSPKAYLHQQQLNQVATLLLESDLPISHIAWNAGFEELSGFNPLFKSHFGVSPGAYRRKHQNNR